MCNRTIEVSEQIYLIIDQEQTQAILLLEKWGWLRTMEFSLGPY